MSQNTWHADDLNKKNEQKKKTILVLSNHPLFTYVMHVLKQDLMTSNQEVGSIPKMYFNILF
uniref:Uncharacterized protein n=1 Tax=Anguilla anguilla TaxID=7936 RepID=A0A0E9WUW5_ANGAN